MIRSFNSINKTRTTFLKTNQIWNSAKVTRAHFASKSTKDQFDNVSSTIESTPTQVAKHAPDSSVFHHTPPYSQYVSSKPDIRDFQLRALIETFGNPASSIDFSLLSKINEAEKRANNADDALSCESVLRKRKRKMNKHKLQKRRWRERMLRRDHKR